MSVAIGWWLISIGFLTGAIFGLFAQSEDWLGGYASRVRRLLRLGHIALIALGALVWQVAFHPDGNRLASASYDRTVKLWDATSGEELLTLKGHTNVLTGVAFSPDGKRIASASYDGTVKVRDIAPRADDDTIFKDQ